MILGCVIQELLLWSAIRLARTIPGGVWARGELVWVTGGQQGCCPWVAHTVRAGCGNSRLVHTESGHETALSPSRGDCIMRLMRGSIRQGLMEPFGVVKRKVLRERRLRLGNGVDLC